MEQWLEIGLAEIVESYANLRLVNPAAERQMEQSLERYGQLSPVVVCRGLHGRYDLVDGFKRLHAARRIGWEKLQARVLPVGEHGAKAAVLSLNWVSQSVSELEEAWVVQSLCREDKLTQVQVAKLLGRNKSWVCRRLSLVERLHEEIQTQLRLGLVKSTVARELARLPRGNQSRVLQAVTERGRPKCPDENGWAMQGEVQDVRRRSQCEQS